MLGSTMAMPGNETHRFPAQGQPRSALASARPLKSSPLAGPAVIVSLIDGTLSSTPAPARPLYLQPQQRNQHDLPVRPKSVHHALTHRSRSISAQSSSRPVSLYAYCPPGPGVVNGNGGGNSTSGHGSPHGSTSSSGNTQHPGSGGSSSNANADANANNIRRKRPSTAPGPSSTSSFDWASNTRDEEKKEEQPREKEEIEEMDISESYSSYTDVHPVLTSAQAQAQPQAQNQTLHNANDTNTDDRAVRYSPDATSPAGPVGGGDVGINSLTGPTTGGGLPTNPIPRPPSILLPESQSTLQPKPILKHHTSFVLSPPPSASSSGSGPGSSMPSLSSSSSRSSFLSTHSSGDIPIGLGPRSSSSSLRSLPSRSQSQTQLRSRSRLSIVSNASCELIKEDEIPIPDLPPPSPTKRRLSQAKSEKQNDGATGIQTTTSRPESWYTFSPYATTPRFSRLGLAGSGVVMPVPKRDMERVLSKRASVIGPAGGIDGRNRQNEGGAGLSRSNTSTSTKSTSSRMSISSRISITSRMSRSGSPPPPIPPIPAGVNSSVPISARGQAQTEKIEHLGIPSNMPRSSARSGATNILAGKSTERSDSNTNSSPSSSSSSSPSCSLSSTDGDKGGESTGASSVSVSNVGIKGEVVVNGDVVGEKGASEGLDGTKKEADAKDMGPNDASTNTGEFKKGHKKNRKSLSETFSGSLKSWRSVKSLRSSEAGAHDVPVSVPALPGPAGLPSGMSGFESAPIFQKVNVHQAAPPAPTANISTAAHASNLDLSATQVGTEAITAPKPTLKKRKSASALLSRVKSWRKKRDDTGMGEGADVLKNAGDLKDEGLNGESFIDTQSHLVVVTATNGVNENAVDPGDGEGGAVVEESLESGEGLKGEDHPGTTSGDEHRRDKPEQHAPPIIVIDVVDVDDEIDEDEDKELDVQTTQMDPGTTHTTVESESDSSSSSSCDSEYPASTPTSTPSSIHSLPSFVPMCVPIPSPNLHVSSSVSSPSSLPAAVPAFVRTQLSSLSPEAKEDAVRSLNPDIPESPSLPMTSIVESSLISGPGLNYVSRDIVAGHEDSVVDVHVDRDEDAGAEELRDEEELGVLTNRDVTETEVDVTPTVVVSHTDRGSCDDAHPIVVPSNDDNDRDPHKAILEDGDCTPVFANARSLTPPTSDSEDPPLEPASRPSTKADGVVADLQPSILIPVQPPTSTSLPSTSPISPPGVPSSDANLATSPDSITNPSSLSLTSTTKSRGRSQSRGRNKGRSGSVRRIWNAFICGASQAEQMAVEEAWAEIREREQQEAVPQAGHEKKKEKSAMTTVSVVDVEPSQDTPEVLLTVHAPVAVTV